MDDDNYDTVIDGCTYISFLLVVSRRNLLIYRVNLTTHWGMTPGKAIETIWATTKFGSCNMLHLLSITSPFIFRHDVYHSKIPKK